MVMHQCVHAKPHAQCQDLYRCVRWRYRSRLEAPSEYVVVGPSCRRGWLRRCPTRPSRSSRWSFEASPAHPESRLWRGLFRGSDVDVGPWVWTRRHVWFWPAQGHIYDTREQFALVRIAAEGDRHAPAADLVDRLLIYRAPILIGEGRQALGYIGLTALADAHGRWELSDTRMLGIDRLEVYERVRTQG